MFDEYRLGLMPSDRWDESLFLFCQFCHRRILGSDSAPLDDRLHGNACASCNGTLKRVNGELVVSRQYD
jgi:hypothetical protein